MSVFEQRRRGSSAWLHNVVKVIPQISDGHDDGSFIVTREISRHSVSKNELTVAAASNETEVVNKYFVNSARKCMHAGVTRHNNNNNNTIPGEYGWRGSLYYYYYYLCVYFTWPRQHNHRIRFWPLCNLHATGPDLCQRRVSQRTIRFIFTYIYYVYIQIIYYNITLVSPDVTGFIKLKKKPKIKMKTTIHLKNLHDDSVVIVFFFFFWCGRKWPEKNRLAKFISYFNLLFSISRRSDECTR